jgi:hypothetical protein
MTGNLVKNGFVVKAFDINAQTLEKCGEYVRLSGCVNIDTGSQAS